jgi:hypothetical protein
MNLLNNNNNNKKMKIRKNRKVVNLTESDLRRIVKKVIKESDNNPTQYHRHRDGSNPGIEDFFKEPTDRTLQDRLKQQLNDDVYSNVNNPTNIGKGTRKLFIYFNGKKMTIEKFIDQVQRDGEEGYCHTIYLYEYDNRLLGATRITIDTNEGPCDEEEREEVVDVDEPVVDKPVEKIGCPQGDKWYENVLKLGTPPSSDYGLVPPMFNWREVIPKMGSSKESVCNCFRKKGGRYKRIHDTAPGFCVAKHPRRIPFRP